MAQGPGREEREGWKEVRAAVLMGGARIKSYLGGWGMESCGGRKGRDRGREEWEEGEHR